MIHISLRLEGALLSRDFMARLASPISDITPLSPQSYGLAQGDKFNEVITRSWNALRGRWEKFQAEAANRQPSDALTGRTRDLWLQPLMQELGFGRVATARPIEVGDKSYPISHAWGNVPVHLIGAGLELDRKTPGAVGAAQMAPHALVQEALNRSGEHQWAILSNGRKLRLLRDNASLSRQAFIEWDLEQIFEHELYSEFALFWLLCHQSRFEQKLNEEAEPQPPIIETWIQSAAQEGIRALDDLRRGVESAITTLGNGFLAHQSNASLRESLESGALSPDGFYKQALRLVYRLLFVLVAEAKDALLDPGAEEEARERYHKYFSLSRMLPIIKSTRGTTHADAWRGLRLTLAQMRGGCAGLALPALGGALFEETVFDGCDISNEALYEALRGLMFTVQNNRRQPVNYRDLGSEELGSVYESLLELTARIEGRHFELFSAAGNERKKTGSYYTPAGLVKSLLDTALQPVIDRALAAPDAQAALLSLKVCDPACGSGHFLTAAARRIASSLARLRAGGDEPTVGQMQAAMREVVRGCIYGVDLNPMAVELCKVALWIESLEPGRPLTFLESRIREGNSLLGTTPALLEEGIPDEAFSPIEGDDKKACAALRKRNKLERAGQASLFDESWKLDLGDLRQTIASIEEVADTDIEGVRAKERMWKALEQSSAYLFTHQLADAWCGAFVWRKVMDTDPKYLPPITQQVFEKLRKNPWDVDIKIRDEIKRLGEQYKWFHPHIELPDVFADGAGGFDAVLGNPPWERVKLQEKEWFAARRPEVALAPNAAARKRLIAALEADDPDLHRAFLDDSRRAEGESHFARSSGKFPLCGRGDVNTYALFAELNRALINPRGRVGCILPSGIATDDTTKFFFRDLSDKNALVSLFDFENREKIFPDVDSRMKFCLLTLAGESAATRAAAFVFFALRPEHIDDEARRFELSRSDIALLNPNTRTCPIFRSSRDAELTKSIYRRVPVLINEEQGEDGNPWGVKFQRMLDMSNDSSLFRTREELEAEKFELRGNVFERAASTWGAWHPPLAMKYLLPLYEAKMLHHFDHRWATYASTPDGLDTRDVTPAEKANASFEVLPRYWVSEAEVEARLGIHSPHSWLLAFRDITNTTNERTVIASILPRVGVGNNAPIMLLGEEVTATQAACLIANLSSFALDFVARFKVGGTHLNFFIAQQLAVLPPSTYSAPCPWAPTSTWGEWISSRVLELTYTAHDLEPFARDLKYLGPPFAWDAERRFDLRCELDAAFFHLYELSRDEAAYVMSTFPIVKRKDEASHGGRFRTSERILELLDEFASRTNGA